MRQQEDRDYCIHDLRVEGFEGLVEATLAISQCGVDQKIVLRRNDRTNLREANLFFVGGLHRHTYLGTCMIPITLNKKLMKK